MPENVVFVNQIALVYGGLKNGHLLTYGHLLTFDNIVKEYFQYVVCDPCLFVFSIKRRNHMLDFGAAHPLGSRN